MLLESKEQLEQQVMSDPGIHLPACGRQDVQTGQVDRRVLATLEFLSVSGLHPTVSSLRCSHVPAANATNAAETSAGDAVEIMAVNGIAIAGGQGPGSITDITIRKLLTLQGTMKPSEIVSLMSYPGTDNTVAAPGHGDGIHVEFAPLTGGASDGRRGPVREHLQRGDHAGTVDPVDRAVGRDSRPEGGQRPVGGLDPRPSFLVLYGIPARSRYERTLDRLIHGLVFNRRALRRQGNR